MPNKDCGSGQLIVKTNRLIIFLKNRLTNPTDCANYISPIDKALFKKYNFIITTKTTKLQLDSETFWFDVGYRLK